MICNKKIRFNDFLKKRALSLFPLLILTTLVMGGLQNIHLLLKKEYWFTIGGFPDFIFEILALQPGFFSANPMEGASWTIGIFMVCYGLFFLIVEKKNFMYIIPILFVSITAIMKEWHYPFFNIYIGRGCLSFTIGVAIAHCFSAISEQQRKKLDMLCLLYSGLLFLWLALLKIRGCSIDKFVGNQYLFIAICLWPAIFVSLIGSRVVSRVASLYVIKILGQISYSVYLWNFPVLLAQVLVFYIMEKVIISSSISFWGLSCVFQLAVASISCFLIEPFVKKKRQTNQGMW